jgi:hypothetical protein
LKTMIVRTAKPRPTSLCAVKALRYTVAASIASEFPFKVRSSEFKYFPHNHIFARVRGRQVAVRGTELVPNRRFVPEVIRYGSEKSTQGTVSRQLLILFRL